MSDQTQKPGKTKNQIYLWGGISLAILGLIFIFQNREDVMVQFLFWDISQPIVVFFFSTMLIGVVAGLLVSQYVIRNKNREIKDLKAQIKEATQKK